MNPNSLGTFLVSFYSWCSSPPVGLLVSSSTAPLNTTPLLLGSLGFPCPEWFSLPTLLNLTWFWSHNSPVKVSWISTSFLIIHFRETYGTNCLNNHHLQLLSSVSNMFLGSVIVVMNWIAVFLQNSYVDILPTHVMALGGVAFGR